MAVQIRIFEACVLSKLLYCLHTAWLNKAELRRLKAFQAKPFRKIHPALLCEQDLKQDCVGAKRPPGNFKQRDLSPITFYLGEKIAALPFTDVRRPCVFSGQTLRPRTAEQPQPRGRPRNSSGSRVYKLATAVVEGADLEEHTPSLFAACKFQHLHC